MVRWTGRGDRWDGRVEGTVDGDLEEKENSGTGGKGQGQDSVNRQGIWHLAWAFGGREAGACWCAGG